MTFVASNQGDVLQKDLGDETERMAANLDAYDPDDTWKDVGD
jgi:hypothetical protein